MRFDPRAVARDFSDAAATYDTHAALQREVLARCAAMIAPCVHNNATVLDAGCGTGALSALPEAAAWNLIGVDRAAGMCAAARATQRYVLLQGAVEQLPLKQGSVDGVVCSLVLQWMNNVPQALGEIARVLKPGGYAVVATFGAKTLQELRAAFSVVDALPHVSDFPPLPAVSALNLVHEECVTITTHEASLLQLMQRLRGIGAANKHVARPRGMMTPRKLARAEAAYPKTPQGLPVTWEIVYHLYRPL